MEVHMGADMEVDKVADMVAKKGTQFGKKRKHCQRHNGPMG